MYPVVSLTIALKTFETLNDHVPVYLRADYVVLGAAPDPKFVIFAIRLLDANFWL
jgi:hypothetical protein